MNVEKEHRESKFIGIVRPLREKLGSLINRIKQHDCLSAYLAVSLFVPCVLVLSLVRKDDLAGNVAISAAVSIAGGVWLGSEVFTSR